MRSSGSPTACTRKAWAALGAMRWRRVVCRDAWHRCLQARPNSISPAMTAIRLNDDTAVPSGCRSPAALHLDSSGDTPQPLRFPRHLRRRPRQEPHVGGAGERVARARQTGRQSGDARALQPEPRAPRERRDRQHLWRRQERPGRRGRRAEAARRVAVISPRTLGAHGAYRRPRRSQGGLGPLAHMWRTAQRSLIGTFRLFPEAPARPAAVRLARWAWARQYVDDAAGGRALPQWPASRLAVGPI